MVPPTLDVTDATFETEVLDRSAQVPVLVDLWAEWCGPCRVLGPILERVVASTDGRVALAKVDVDANPRVAATFGVQSIPAVFALRDRQVVDSFIGALPEPAVAEFVARLAPPGTEAGRLVAQGDEASLRAALELQPDHPGAVMALAEQLVDRGGDAEREEALALLARLPETPESRRLAARARVPNRLADEDLDRRLADLLERAKDDEGARREFLDLLEVLGADDPRTPALRRALASRLY